jgi:hypothetical protein
MILHSAKFIAVVLKTHNQRERHIGATLHRIVRSNMQEIKLRC